MADIYASIRMRRNDEIEIALQTNPKLLTMTRGCLKETPLHEAVNSQNIVAVRLLLQHGARCDVGDSVSDTPLHKAACIGLPNILQELVCSLTQLKIHINSVRTCAGSTALHVACEHCHDDCVAVLLAAGSGVNVQDQKGFTPLHVAAGKFKLKVVELLLDAHADLTIEAHSPAHHASKTGKSPIHYAMACHKPRHTKVMIARLSDDLHGEIIVGLLDYALDIEALDCKACDMVGIILESTNHRVGSYDVFRPVIESQIAKGNVKLDDLPEELKSLANVK